MRLYQMADAVRYEMMNTEELRETFLLEGLFQPGEIEFAYVDLDRTVIGSAVPVSEEFQLETEPELRAEYFLERRELGVFNVGGPGTVVVDGKSFDLTNSIASTPDGAATPLHFQARTERIPLTSISSAIPRTRSIPPRWSNSRT